MGRIGSSIFFGITTTLMIIHFTFIKNKLLVGSIFTLMLFIGSLKQVSKIYNLIIERQLEYNIARWKRILNGILLSIISSIFILGITQNVEWVFLSLPFIYIISYSTLGSFYCLKYYNYIKQKRKENLIEKNRLLTIQQEEYAREKGRVNANPNYGYTNRPININIRGNNQTRGDEPFNHPINMNNWYNNTEKRAKVENKNNIKFMKNKI